MEKWILYFFPFAEALGISLFLSLVFIFFLKNFSIKKRKGKRHLHHTEVSRWGGLAIVGAFLAILFFDSHLVLTTQLWGVIFASFLILVIGIADDLWQLEWKTQLFFQVCAAMVVFILGVQVEYITNPFGGVIFLATEKYLIPSLIFGIFWIVVFMNAMNWVDGVDGLSGGITFIGSVVLFFLSLKPEVNQPPVAIICAALAGATLGFLILNFHPAKILAGTSGSMFMGFMLAVLAIFAGAKIATALLVMSIPLVDVIGVIFGRLKRGVSIFKPDCNHLHHKLMKLGWSVKKIALFYYFISILIGIVALNTRLIGKMATILVVFFIIGVFIFFINTRLARERKIISE